MLNKKLFFYLEVPMEDGFHIYVDPFEKKLLTLNLLIHRSLDFRLNCPHEKTYIVAYEKVHYKLQDYLILKKKLLTIYGDTIDWNYNHIKFFMKKSQIINQMFNSPFLDTKKGYLNRHWYFFDKYEVKLEDVIININHHL